MFARLKPGVPIEQATTGLNVLYRGIINDVEAPLQRGMSEQTMTRFRARQLRLEPGFQGQSSVRAEAGTPLKLLLAVTGLVLVIACANIANLLLARAARRSGEMAIRLSIGANRAQLIRQLLTESLILATLGGAAGLLVAQWTLHLIASLLPDDAASTFKIELDPIVLLFAAVLTIGTGFLFGLFPALHSTRPDLLPTLKGQSGQPSGAKGAARFRTSLATFQIAISMTLLIAAGLFVKSLAKVSRVELGLKTDNIVTFGVSPELNAYTPRTVAGALFADRTGDGVDARCHRRHGCPRRTDRRQQLGHRCHGPGVSHRTGRRQQLPLQHDRARLLQHPRHPADRRPRVHRSGRRQIAESGDRQ